MPDYPIYQGDLAKQLCKHLLAPSATDPNSMNYNARTPHPFLDIHSAGYWQNEKGTYTAYDNVGDECFMEDFDTQQEAIAWCQNKN